MFWYLDPHTLSVPGFISPCNVFFLLKLNLQPQVYVTSIKANAIFTKERCQDWEKRNRHNAVSMKSSIVEKGTKIAHIYCIFIVVFFYLFSKRRRAFFKLTSFRAWLWLRRRFLLICKQTEIIFGRKKTWLHHFVGSLTQLGLGTVWMNLLIVDLVWTKEGS